MSDDNLSKTMIIPNPGGRRSTNNEIAQPPPQQQPSPPPIQQNVTQTVSRIGTIQGENIVLSCSSEILALAGNLKSLEPSNTIEQLRVDVDRLILQFTNQLTNSNIPKEVVLTARYIICCLLDELILSTPWGNESSWSQQTLLGKYHNETWGGEKFFLIINKLLEQPQRNLNLIELCYVCLAVGFSGKYRVVKNGENELIRIGQAVYQQIEKYRPIDRDLSPSWQGEGITQQSLVRRFPTWVIFFILSFIIAGVYIGFLSNLQTRVDPIYQNLESIGWKDFVVNMNKKQENIVDLNSIILSLNSSLKKEISESIVETDIKDSMIIIRFTSTSLFKSGSSYLNDDALPDVNKLVNIIRQYASSVLVIGHTDSTGKADSNWVISRKRAEVVATWLMSANYQLPNIITRGLADTQPLHENDSSYNRSLNRRVELILVLKGSR